jgi:hypothetical protein
MARRGKHRACRGAILPVFASAFLLFRKSGIPASLPPPHLGEPGICSQHCAQRMIAIEVAVIGVVVGIVLGLRYKVLILVPAALFAMISAIIIGVAHADGFWSMVLMTVELITAVQLGYLAGTVTHMAIAAIFPLWKGGGNSDPGRNSQTEMMS